MRYVRGILRKPLPKGTVLVHNHVVPQRKLGKKGLRAWTQLLTDNLAAGVAALRREDQGDFGRITLAFFSSSIDKPRSSAWFPGPAQASPSLPGAGV